VADGDRCSRCSSDLSGVPPAARFCPNCGVRLSDARAQLVITQIDPLPTTAVVRGYASAMFRLGFHYEIRHNDDEAVRCYGKASRLGHSAAKTRMLDIPIAALADDPADV
jgi:TPR repeat protein